MNQLENQDVGISKFLERHWPLIFLLLITFHSTNLLGQEDLGAEIVPPSPDAAKIAQFGITPTNLYTGAHNLSIPLYEIDFDGARIPITLSYNSGGIKAAEDATWVGLGWSLSTVGVVSRTIFGFNDFTNANQHIGWLKDYTPIPNEIQFQDDYWQGMTGGRRDTEPDQFSYNFMGSSGKFIFRKRVDQNDSYEAIKLDTSQDRIEYNSDNHTFTITTTSGFIGEFTIKERSTSFSSSTRTNDRWEACNTNLIDIQTMDLNNRLRQVTSWYLSKITSPKGSVLNLKYRIGEDGYSKYLTASAPFFGEMFSDYSISAGGNSGNNDPFLWSCSRTVHEHVYLEEITSPDFQQSIRFLSEDRQDQRKTNLFIAPGTGGHFPSEEELLQPQRLTKIIVENEQDVIKTIDFQQSYFNENTPLVNRLPDEDKYRALRLRLDGLVIDDQRYQFDYFDGLPDKSTISRDYWDYYNGKNNSRLWPASILNNFAGFMYSWCDGFTDEETYYYQTEERMANLNAGRAGTLRQITYPTGGQTVYEYENHEYITSPQEVVNESHFVTYAAHSINGYAEQVIDVRDIPACFSVLQPDIPSVLIDASLSCMFDTNNTGDPFATCGHNGTNDFNVGVEVVRLNDDGTEGEIIRHVDWAFLDNLNNGESSYSPGTFGLPNGGKYVLKAFSRRNADGSVRSNSSIVARVPSECDARVSQNINSGGFNLQTQKAGGLRIKSITNYDIDGTFIERRAFEYQGLVDLTEFGVPVFTEEEYSSGKLVQPLLNVFVERVESEGAEEVCRFFINAGSTINGTYAAQGSHIGYSKVRELFTNQTGKIFNGWRDHHFINKRNDVLPYNQGTLNYSEINGQVTDVKTFNSDGELLEAVKYNNIYEEVGSIRFVKYELFGSQVSVPGFINIYHRPIRYVAPKQMINTRYQGGKSIETIQDTEYNDEYFPWTVTTTDSEGRTRSSLTRRAKDYETPGPVLQEMIAQNQIGMPIEVIQKVNGAVTNAQATSYQVLEGIILPSVVYQYESSTPGADFQPSDNGVTFSAYEPELEYTRFDEDGNIIEYRKDEDVFTSIIWGYTKEYPIAQLTNATYAEIEAILGVDFPLQDPLGNTLSQAQISSLRAGLPNAFVTTYTYIPGIGIKTMTDPNGLTTSYDYDDYRRLKTVKDHEAKKVVQYDYHYKLD